MTESRRVLFIDQSGQLGGAELMLADIAERFRENGSVLLFAEGPFRQHLEKRGVTVQVVGNGRLSGVTKGAGVRAWLEAVPSFVRLTGEVWRASRDGTVLYANTAKALIVGALVALVRRQPLIFHLHDLVTEDHFSRLNRWLLVRVASVGARVIIANSEASRAAFFAAGGRCSRVVVIYNGFNPERFVALPGAAIRIRTEFGIENRPLAVVAGRLTPWKGQHVLLAALQRIPELHVLLVGGALFTAADRAYEAQLRQAATEGNLQGRVHFAGQCDDVVPFYHAADVVVHCSVAAEPFGRVVVEAMLAGRPVVASDAGGVREILQEPGTGELVPPADAVALATALGRLLNNPGLASKIALAGQQAARRRFNLDEVLRKIEGVVATSHET